MSSLFFRGDVVTMECVEKLIKKDWQHPLTSQKLTEKDIIFMQRVYIRDLFELSSIFLRDWGTNFVFIFRVELGIQQQIINWKENTRDLFYRHE